MNQSNIRGQSDAPVDWWGEVTRWISNIPLFCRSVIFVTLIASLIWQYKPEEFYPKVENDPEKIYGQYEIWRFFTATFVLGDPINLSISLFWMGFNIAYRERSMGTVPFFIYFCWMSIISQIIIAIIYFIPEAEIKKRSVSLGLWSFIMADITISSIKEPRAKIKIWCWPFTIDAKYIPYVFLIILFLLAGDKYIAILAGFITGILYCYNVLFFAIPSRFTKSWVFKLIFRWFRQNAAFINDPEDPDYSLELENQPSDNQQIQFERDRSQNTSRVNAFRGSSVAVGSSQPNPPPNNNQQNQRNAANSNEKNDIESAVENRKEEDPDDQEDGMI